MYISVLEGIKRRWEGEAGLRATRYLIRVSGYRRPGGTERLIREHADTSCDYVCAELDYHLHRSEAGKPAVRFVAPFSECVTSRCIAPLTG